MGDLPLGGAYADIDGLHMYYEVHGKGEPLVLLHGALSATETSFGALIPALSDGRQLIAVEQQAHGRMADVDRPLSIRQMADDTAALLARLGIARADVFGYSMGAAIGLDLALRRPELVRKLVHLSSGYQVAGLHPGLLVGLEEMSPEMLAGSPFEAEYLRLAPEPANWPVLIEKNKQLDKNLPDIPAEVLRTLTVPVLVAIGDSDIITPEHAVDMFRQLGGGVVGDLAGLPASQLAILPGTTHVTAALRSDLLPAIVAGFLDAK